MKHPNSEHGLPECILADTFGKERGRNLLLVIRGRMRKAWLKNLIEGYNRHYRIPCKAERIEDGSVIVPSWRRYPLRMKYSAPVNIEVV